MTGKLIEGVLGLDAWDVRTELVEDGKGIVGRDDLRLAKERDDGDGEADA